MDGGSARLAGLTVDLAATRRSFEETEDDFDGRALAGTVGTQQAEDFVVADF